MKKIGVDIRILNNKHKTGIEQYTYQLFTHLLKYNDDNYYMIGDILDEKFKKLKSIDIDFDLPMSNNDFSNKMLCLMGFLSDLDLVHSTYFPIPKNRTFKAVLTVHDLIPIRNPEWFPNKRVYDFMNIDIRQAVKYADHIIASSEATKKDIIEFFSTDEKKISVVYCGCDHVLLGDNTIDKKTENDILKKYNIEKDYILSVCTIEPRKNIERVLQAYQIIRDKFKTKVQLVLVGKLGWHYEKLMQIIKESKYSDDIIFTGYVSDNELPIIFKNAEVFIYASLFEGFGIPVAEAMACGTAVITSDTSSLPEVGGDAVLYCNPYDIESIAYSIEKILTKPSLKNELREKGMTRASMLTWDKTAKKTRDVYLKCLK